MKQVRFGASGQLPMIIDAPATLKMRLPTAAEFDQAHQDGQDVHIHFALPAIVRFGVEARPIDALRIELTYVREFWSIQKAIDVHNINTNLDGVAAGVTPNVHIPDIAFPRNFQDSNSFRLGAEYHYTLGGYPVDTRLGVNYETSGVPADYLSLSSLDFDKVTLSFGGSLYVGKHWRLDGLFAHLFAVGVFVPAEEAKIGRINPLNGNAPFEPVNGGTYKASADLIGVGLNYRF
jgi:long-chain fatty acid transport protein